MKWPIGPLIGGFCLAVLQVVFLVGDPQAQRLLAPVTLFLVALSIGSVLYYSARSRSGDPDWFAPGVWVSATYLIYILLPAIWLWVAHDYTPLWLSAQPDFPFWANTVLAITALSVIAFCLVHTRKQPRPRQWVIRQKRWWLVVLSFLAIGGAAKLYHLSIVANGISLDSLRQLSPTFRRENSAEISFAVLILESMLDWAFLLMVYRMYLVPSLPKRRAYILLVLMLGVLVLVSDYLVAAKRSAVMPLFLIPLIWRHYLVQRLSFRGIATVAVLIAFSVASLLMLRIVLPLIADGLVPTDFVGEDFGEVSKFYFDSPEWATFEMTVASFSQRDQLVFEAGGPLLGFLKYSLSTLIVFIPRAIWPSKPSYEDLSYVYYHVIWGGTEPVGMAPTLWGSGHLFFYSIGVFAFLVTAALASSYCVNRLSPGTTNYRGTFLYGIFLWMLFQYVRFGTLGFTFLYFVQAMAIGVVSAFILFKKAQ